MLLNTWDTASYQCLWNLNEEEQEQRETNNTTGKQVREKLVQNMHISCCEAQTSFYKQGRIIKGGG